MTTIENRIAVVEEYHGIVEHVLERLKISNYNEFMTNGRFSKKYDCTDVILKVSENEDYVELGWWHDYGENCESHLVWETAQLPLSILGDDEDWHKEVENVKAEYAEYMRLKEKFAHLS